QGRYWFELQEPGGDPYRIGESFYVRGGRIDADVPPEDFGLDPADVPVAGEGSSNSVSLKPVGFHSAEGELDSTVSSTEGIHDSTESSEVIKDDQAAATEFSAAGAAAVAGVGLLRGRWRHRFNAVEHSAAPAL